MANHLTMAMLNVAGEQKLVKQILQQAGEQNQAIPFIGTPGHFQIAPYADVLQKRIPASFF